MAILAIVWFGSNFFGIKDSNQMAAPAASQAKSNQEFFAGTLPVADETFLQANNDSILPIRKWSVSDPQLTAESIYVFDVSSGKVLLEKKAEEIRPIASLSKLVTALVIMERADLNDKLLISKNAVDTLGEMGNLKIGEEMSVEGLLYAMLIESSNDAAMALAESASGGDGQFVGYMNQKAEQLGLKNTHFSDPSGLSTENVSTAKELALIMQEVIKYPLLNQIMKTPEIDILSLDGKHNHHLTNSDKLLQKYPEIIAGKTGFIDEAGNCMILAIQPPGGKGAIINVILDTQDRMGEMEKLIQWEKEAYLW